MDERGANFLIRIDFFFNTLLASTKLQIFFSIKFLNFKFIGLLGGCSGTGYEGWNFNSGNYLFTIQN